MSRQDYIPKDRDRVEVILDSLLSFAKDSLNYYTNFDVLDVKWEDNSNILQIRTTKKSISLLVNEHKGILIKDWEVNSAISYLRELGIIKGKSQKGRTILEFRLELCSKDKQTNLNKFRQDWEKQKQKIKSQERIRLNPDPFVKRFEKELNSWKAQKENIGVIYSAPAAAFLGGEHAVVFGHPAIYYPLPLRLYVHLEPDRHRHNITINEYIVPDPKNINTITNIKRITHYGDTNVSEYFEAINNLFFSIIYPFLSEKTGFKISVLSSFPLAVGLNSSGAFAVGLAQALADHYINMESFKAHFDMQDADKNNVVLLLAWAIENCSHGNCSSGAGIHASFYGRKGRHPLIYCSSRRSRLAHRLSTGWNPVNLQEDAPAIKNLLKLKTFIFDPAEPGNNLPSYPEPPYYNITLLYSGIFSKTKQALSKHSIRTYTQASQERVKHIYNKFNKEFRDTSFQRSLEIHVSEILGKIYLNNELDIKDKSEQLDYAYLELLTEALGNICVSLLNSVLSADWKFVPDLMASCQSLLSSMEYSHQNIDYFVARLQANALQYKIDNNAHDILPKISAKLTGAGKGGDIIVFSLYESDIHQQLIEKTRNSNNIIHFDSSTMFSEKENALVEGVRQLI